VTPRRFWNGKPFEALEHEEMIEALEWAFEEISRQRQEFMAMMPSINWVEYFKAKAKPRGRAQGASDDV